MVGPSWRGFLDLSDNSVLSGLMGPSHYGQLARNDVTGTANNKFAWFERESISKYDLCVLFYDFLAHIFILDAEQ